MHRWLRIIIDLLLLLAIGCALTALVVLTAYIITRTFEPTTVRCVGPELPK